MPVKRYFQIALLLLILLAANLPLAGAQDAGQGRICVAAYADANANGVREPMEPLLADVVVSLQNDQAIGVASYVTNGQAEPYCFDGLSAGTYYVNFSGGMVLPTREADYAVTLAAGQTLPAQVLFGAVREDAVPAAAASPDAPVINQTDRLLRAMFALGGALLVMAVLGALGLVIFWARFRRAR